MKLNPCKTMEDFYKKATELSEKKQCNESLLFENVISKNLNENYRHM